MVKGRCSRALIAAMDVIQEECKDTFGHFIELDDGIIVYFPKEEIDRLGHTPGNPVESAEKLEELVSHCVNGTWVREWARKVLGPDATEDMIKKVAERVCRKLFTH